MSGNEKLFIAFGIALAAGVGYALAPKKNTVIHNGVEYEEAEVIPIHTPGSTQWNISGEKRIVISHGVSELTDEEVALISAATGYTHAAQQGFRSTALLLQHGDQVIWWNPISQTMDAVAFLDELQIKGIA